MHKTHYPTNLTDKQWQVIEKIIDVKKSENTFYGNLFNAISYLLKNGRQWRMLLLHVIPFTF